MNELLKIDKKKREKAMGKKKAKQSEGEKEEGGEVSQEYHHQREIPGEGGNGRNNEADELELDACDSLNDEDFRGGN